MQQKQANHANKTNVAFNLSDLGEIGQEETSP